MWFTETPWPPIFILAVIAACLAAAFSATQRSVYLAGILVLALLGGGIYFIEKQIVTEAERVEAAIYGVTDAFQDRDVERTVSYFSDNAALPDDRLPPFLRFVARNVSLRTVVAGAVSTIQVEDDLRITDVSVETSNNDSLAKSHFRANGSFIVPGAGNVGHQPTRWEFRWRQEAGEWRIIDVQRLDPINGEPMGVFERSASSR